MNQSLGSFLTPVAPVPGSCRAVALLVDGENLPPPCAERLPDIARLQLGPLAVLRVYGDAARLPGWTQAPGFQFIHAKAGKNVTDMLLTVEAMEMSFADAIDGFAIASADRDFAPLAWSLRRRGFPVLGLMPRGAASTHLLRAFTRHTLIDPPEPAQTAAIPPETPPAPLAVPPSTAGTLRLAAIRAVLKTPMNPAEFGAAMNRAGYKRPAGAARWQSWLTANAPFVRITGTGAATRFLID